MQVTYSRVEGLDSTRQHLRCVRDGGYIFHFEARLSNHPGGASRCQDADIVLDQTLGKVKKACFVIDREDG